MKIIKIIAAFCCLFSVFNNSVAQEYVIPNGRRWIYHEHRPLFPSYGDRIAYYDAKGDTLINGNKYSVIYPGYDVSYVRWEGTKCLRYWPMTQRDTLVFDESWNVGDTTIMSNGEYKTRYFYEVDSISEQQGRKCWWIFGIGWLQGIGFMDLTPFYIEFDLKGGVSLDLICCIDPGNDTLYVNRDLLPLLQTGIKDISADNVSFSQQGERCIVTLPYDASAWSATLYNSVGVTVARRSGEGSEIILPATSKGTHILVVNADGRVVKKKVYIK